LANNNLKNTAKSNNKNRTTQHTSRTCYNKNSSSAPLLNPNIQEENDMTLIQNNKKKMPAVSTLCTALVVEHFVANALSLVPVPASSTMRITRP
jgi:hypothetical protein